MSVQVHVLDTPELGDRSYLVEDGSVGVVVDPQRDLDRIERVIADAGVQVQLVVETHIHNDYVTGGLELARRHGARYAVNADDPVTFDRHPVRDGDALDIGTMQVSVLATPGHTVTHLAYRVQDTAAPESTPMIFTGGSLLFGSVGRTDLVSAALTHELTHRQYHSARRLADELPDAAEVFPTHGFGSFCSSGSATGGDASTIGAERARNDALTTADEDTFVENLIANLTAYPAYYAHMAPLNLAGPAVPDLESPAAADPDELGKRIAAGEWIVDLRDRTAYAADHVRGSVGIELGTQFATYLGWLKPWDTPLTLIGDSAEQVRDAQRQLVRIGIDRIDSAATGDLDATAAGLDRHTYPKVTFAEATSIPDGDSILDVRRDDEYAAGHVDGAAHVPLHSLLRRLGDLPAGRLWVHCASGFRAGIAASLLDRDGRDVVYIDDDFGNAAKAGLPMA